MMDYEVQQSVSDELVWDPKVDSEAIGVSADDGVVTLRGTVGSFREKGEAERAAKRVYGVKSVKNELEVRILDTFGREDADLRGAVLQAMALDSLIPNTIDAKVWSGEVTLTGTAIWQYQCDEAEFIAGNVLGVLDVTSTIDVKNPQVEAVDIQESIKQAFRRMAHLDADGLSVDSDNGIVTVNGAVGSWFEHDAAMSAAWAAPGVTMVEDNILVLS